MPYCAAGIENLELLRYLKILKKNFVGVCSPTSTTTSSATPGGGKMLLDSTSRELSFETNLSAANSITKRSIYGMNVNRHVPRSLDHFVGDPLVILRSLPQFCRRSLAKLLLAASSLLALLNLLELRQPVSRISAILYLLACLVPW